MTTTKTAAISTEHIEATRQAALEALCRGDKETATRLTKEAIALEDEKARS
jgi:hypothetical protein